MKKSLYIDTNVYLTFYHFSNEDLEELKKLIALINTGNLVLFLPEQTKNEFYRNREVKISDSLSKLKSSKFENQFPLICHSYEEYDFMKKAIKSFDTNKKKLLEKLQHDAENETLLADDVLNQLFSCATIIKTNQDILDKSILRFDLGNPPGKDKSYGDSINWESLLFELPIFEDLYFISDDKDFYSKLNDKKFNDFLLKEWKEKKQSELLYFRRLTDFFNQYFPDIEITSETEKDILIKNLFEAYNFENAKNVINRIRNYDKFSVKQINEIAKAFTKNNQIYWIKTDYSVRQAISEIITPHRDKINEDILEDFDEIY